jgi:hypothetical protein
MVQDWWPDDWDFPVGYHVTVPCDAGDTAYRTFAQAFALDDSGPGTPRLVYQHDLLRDGDLVDTHFGVNGLCRSLNWGVDAFVTNTMRYCTRSAADETADYAVDRTAESETGAWAAWACSTSHTDLPWPSSAVKDSINTDTFESNLYSVGTVPNIPVAGAEYYPQSLDDDMYDPGPWQEILKHKGWGQDCSEFALHRRSLLCTYRLRCYVRATGSHKTRLKNLRYRRMDHKYDPWVWAASTQPSYG